eukprot:m.9424 g.9424  ORF g.9424 m.9424 type:complete len:292 (-) comp6348_c0_seq1:238-1113(-)
MPYVFVNGEYMLDTEATISVFDRGFLFSDAIYEVVKVVEGVVVDADLHLGRLRRSLSEIDMGMPMEVDEIIECANTLVKKNKMTEGFVYMQVSRGVGPRSFVFSETLKQTVVMIANPLKIIDSDRAKGMHVKTEADIRWRRCDVKTTQLLPSSLLKTRAVKEGYDGIWYTDPDTGYLTEGDSNNLFIVKGKFVITASLERNILPGITRRVIRELVDSIPHLTFVERDISLQEAYEADEAFCSAATLCAAPILSVNRVKINGGKIGAITTLIRKKYIERIYRCIKEQEKAKL